jgi:FHS family L-fucose permease-like MFS transporter
MANSTPKTSSLITLILVFFFWGFVAASNDILIPVFKEHLHLEQWQAQMVSFAFYVAYTVGSILYFLLSRITGGDILNRIGYKNGIALGLVISAVGTILFYPAAEASSFAIFITGLFIVGLGFALQQIAANPLMINLGDPAKGSQRLSMAGGVNNIGTTIGPVIVSFAIFGALAKGAKLENLSSVKGPYLILGLAFIIVALLIKFSSLPNHIVHEDTVADRDKPTDNKSIFSYPQLWMGMIAIFLYVGVEVSTGANLAEYLKQHLHVPTDGVAPYVSLFWASLMIGRWTGAVGAFDLSKGVKQAMNFILPYAAFVLFLVVNYIANNDLGPFYMYAGVIIVIIAANVLSKGSPARMLVIHSVLGIIALLIGMFTNGLISAYAFISVGLFCSTLWPCIFTLAITGLGKRTNDGSSFLIMMIMGGGIISSFQGYVAKDQYLGIQYSYVVGVVCFAYLAFYGWKMRNLLAKHNVIADEVVSTH